MSNLEPRSDDGLREEDLADDSLRDILARPVFAALLDFSIGVLVTCFFIVAMT